MIYLIQHGPTRFVAFRYDFDFHPIERIEIRAANLLYAAELLATRYPHSDIRSH